MKKIILSMVAVAGLTMSSFGQGILLEDNSNAAYDTTINGVINTTQDLNLELLVGTSSTSITTDIVTLLLSSSASPTATDGGVGTASGDISAAGYIYDLSGTSYDLSQFAGQTLSMEVEAWTGNYSSYAAAVAAGDANVPGVFYGTSQIFTGTVGANAQSFPIDISGVGVIPLTVPEPATMAMAGLGGLSLLFLRRKK